jgi:transcription-repair coupling factor (superfamily II helicase)
VPDLRLKIDLYRRLARVSNLTELADLTGELADRFGPRPEVVERMLVRSELAILASMWRIDSIHLEDGFAVFGYRDRGEIEKLAKRRGGRVRVVDARSAYLPIAKDLTSPGEIEAAIKSVLQPN